MKPSTPTSGLSVKLVNRVLLRDNVRVASVASWSLKSPSSVTCVWSDYPSRHPSLETSVTIESVPHFFVEGLAEPQLMTLR